MYQSHNFENTQCLSNSIEQKALPEVVRSSGIRLQFFCLHQMGCQYEACVDWAVCGSASTSTSQRPRSNQALMKNVNCHGESQAESSAVNLLGLSRILQ